MFPVDKEIIDAVYAANGGDDERTINALLEMAGQQDIHNDESQNNKAYFHDDYAQVIQDEQLARQIVHQEQLDRVHQEQLDRVHQEQRVPSGNFTESARSSALKLAESAIKMTKSATRSLRNAFEKGTKVEQPSQQRYTNLPQ